MNRTGISILISMIVFQIILVVLMQHFAPQIVTINPINGTLPSVGVWNVITFNGSGLQGMFGLSKDINVSGVILADLFWGVGLIEVICVIYLIRGD